jgi:hypothetical protein
MTDPLNFFTTFRDSNSFSLTGLLIGYGLVAGRLVHNENRRPLLRAPGSLQSPSHDKNGGRYMYVGSAAATS